MLRRVEIKDFRSCHGIVLDNLGPTTVLAGRNAVGKTNILRAIEWAAGIATSEKVLRFGNWGHVSLQAIAGDTVYNYTVDAEVAHSSNRGQPNDSLFVESLECRGNDGRSRGVFDRRQEEVHLLQTGEVLRIGALAPCMPALISLMPTASPHIDLIRPFLDVVQRTRYYPLDVSADDDSSFIVDQTEFSEWLTRYRATGSPGESLLCRLLYMYQANKSQLEEIVGLLGTNGLGLIDEVEVLPMAKSDGGNSEKETNWFFWLRFRPSRQSGTFNFRELSTGTQRIIRLIVSLVFDRSAVMLVEHPEDGIHGALLRKLLDVLQKYSDQSQLILTSHSPAVFNTLYPTAVRLVTMDGGETKVRALTQEELRAAARFMEEDGSLSDFIETVEED